MTLIEIVMPTYNCAPWLDDFMDSLLVQDFAGWHLIARDDASTDSTADKLAKWHARLGDRMEVLAGSGEKNLGIIDNYNALLAATNASWVMCADPDDVWLPGKIAMSLAAMRRTEAMYGQVTPIVVCTDAKVVDDRLRSIAPSFWRLYRMHVALVENVPRLAMESMALGSTLMVNRPLLDLAVPIETGAAYQDWWMALVAAAFGQLVPLSEQTILYRRHGTNETSNPFAADIGNAVLRTLASPKAPQRHLQTLLRQAGRQAEAFLARYRFHLPSSDIAALESLADLRSLGPVTRRLAVMRHGLWFGSAMKNLALLALV